MKTLFNNLCIILIVFAFGSTSCSKSDDSSPPPTTSELLVNKWFYVKAEDTSTSPPTVVLADDCGRQGYINFLPNGLLFNETFYIDSNNHCVSNGIIGLTYSLTANEEQIIASDGTTPETWDIDVLTKTKLILSTGTLTLFYKRGFNPFSSSH